MHILDILFSCLKQESTSRKTGNLGCLNISIRTKPQPPQITFVWFAKQFGDSELDCYQRMLNWKS